MNRKIKIVYLIDSFSLGGAEKFLLNLSQGLDRERFDIQIAAVVFAGALEEEFRKTGFPIRVFEKKGKISLSLIGELKKYLQEVKPDIVHTNLFGADTWGRIAAILARVPIIVSTEHNVNLDEPWFKKIIKHVLSWFTKKIVAVSEGVRDYSVQVEKITANKIKLIYYGIDLQRFPFRGYKPLDITQPINAVTVGRLVAQKGQKYLIEAMSLIVNQLPNFKLHIVGAGPLESELKVQVKTLSLEKNIEFYGQRLDIETIFPQMDIFILPSLWEGLGLVLLEAQAVGLPILASDIPAVSEIVIDNETGLLFPSKNSPAIWQKVNYLLHYPAVVEEIVTKAHQQVTSQFNLAKMITSYANLYESLIKSKAHKS